LDWLSTVPSARRIRERLHAFLYTPEPDGLVTYISAYGSQAELTYSFTGSAAAHVYGATVTTAVPVTTLRVGDHGKAHGASATLEGRVQNIPVLPR